MKTYSIIENFERGKDAAFVSKDNPVVGVLTEEQLKDVLDRYGIRQKQLSEYAAEDVVNIGKFEMVVLEQREGETYLILKDLYGEESEFGENNNYDGSLVDKKCQEFAQELAERVGWDNITLHQVDLTSDDGLKDYGTVERRASLITADMYRKYVDILDEFKLDRWWWLATPWSTKRHANDSWVKCVAPSGRVNLDGYYCVRGVRPFCILKSNIFVSG